jgi:hypothetical protein
MKVTITLEEEDLLALNEILVDGDPDDALAFVKERIWAKVPARGDAPCDSTRLNPYLLKRGRGSSVRP